MATVTGYTAARMQEIEDAAIVDGDVVGDNLILTRYSGATINAGSVRGPVGPQGPLNDSSITLIPPGAPGTDISEALVDAHVNDFGTVRLEGKDYTIGGSVGTAALDIFKPGVNLDLNGATIHYTGAGVCLRKRMVPFTIDNAGYVCNGTIDGSTASAGAIGIQTGSVIGAGWEGVNVNNFDKAGSVNWDQYNEAANTWMERCRFERCDSRYGTILWQWRSHATSSSFLYNDYSDARFAGNPTQLCFKTIAPAQVYDSIFGFRGNVTRDSIVFDLAPESLLRPIMCGSVEQTEIEAEFLTSVLFAPGSSDIRYPRGSFQVNNFPNFSEARQISDFENRDVLAILDPFSIDGLKSPLHGFGLSIAPNHLGVFAAVYDGGVGADFALLKIPFGGDLADSRVAAQLDSITKAEIGFRPGVYTLGGATPAPPANTVPEGTMVYIINSSLGKILAVSDGTIWRDAMGSPVTV
jgi:hypothetical protein